MIKQAGSQFAIDLVKRKLFRSSDPDSVVSDYTTSSSANGNAVPRRLSNASEMNILQPIKSGWLLKKRDIIFGWQCRYFVVYVGRVEVIYSIWFCSIVKWC